MKKSTYTIGHIFRVCHNVRIDIYKQHTECDRNKQKRLESLLDSKVKEYAGLCFSPFWYGWICLIHIS